MFTYYWLFPFTTHIPLSIYTQKLVLNYFVLPLLRQTVRPQMFTCHGHRLKSSLPLCQVLFFFFIILKSSFVSKLCLCVYTILLLVFCTLWIKIDVSLILPMCLNLKSIKVFAFEFLAAAGFRCSRSERMAGWMWLRCVLGPNLLRIHRSPDQSRHEGRTGRRVGTLTTRRFHFNTAERRKTSVIRAVTRRVATATLRKYQVFVIDAALSPDWQLANEWNDRSTFILRLSKATLNSLSK